ncbi:MAG: hypothetical protein JST48_08445 [Bacteroidetes bacterium]|nr:hypothetical protein [Bacteroidota bacterium]
MKDLLKKFVDENREGFDNKNTPESAWTKIEASLPKKSKQFFLNSVPFWRAAALILLGLSLYLLTVKTDSVQDKKETAELKGFSDLESYYSMQITEKMDLISQYQSRVEGNEDEITQNLKKLQAMYLVLKDQFKKHPTEDVRDALILNLLIRVDLMNQQLNKFDKPNGKPVINS